MISSSKMAHPFLQFNPNIEREHNSLVRLNSLMMRELEPSQIISWPALTIVNQEDSVHDLLTPPWERLFTQKRPQYRELVLEFCSTITCIYPCLDLLDREKVTFRLDGVWLECSVMGFGKRPSLYTNEEIDTLLFTYGIHEFPPESVCNTFWERVSDGIHDPQVTKSNAFKIPVHRYLQTLIVHTISGLCKSTEVITVRDLFYLNCLAEPASCNLAHCMVYFFNHAIALGSTGRICGGSYISRIARFYRILTPKNIATMTRTCEVQ